MGKPGKVTSITLFDMISFFNCIDSFVKCDSERGECMGLFHD